MSQLENITISEITVGLSKKYSKTLTQKDIVLFEKTLKFASRKSHISLECVPCC